MPQRRAYSRRALRQRRNDWVRRNAKVVSIRLRHRLPVTNDVIKVAQAEPDPGRILRTGQLLPGGVGAVCFAHADRLADESEEGADH